MTPLWQYGKPDCPQWQAHIRLLRPILLVSFFFLPSCYQLWVLELFSFLIFKDSWDEANIIRVLAWSVVLLIPSCWSCEAWIIYSARQGQLIQTRTKITSPPKSKTVLDVPSHTNPCIHYRTNLNKMHATETMRRIRLPLISGNGSYPGFSLGLIYRKDAQTNSCPCLETISAIHSFIH